LREPPVGPDRAVEVTFALEGLEGSTLVHVSASVAHRSVSRVLLSGDVGEIEALGTLGARGDGALFARGPRGTEATPLPFEPEDPYAAQLRAFAARAPAGFVADDSILANVDVIDAILSPLERDGHGEHGEERDHGNGT
jgi:hypothetical protein